MKAPSISFRPLAVALAAGFLLAGCASQGSFNPRPVASRPGLDTASDLRVADSALQAGDSDLAVSLYERVLKADPHSVGALLGLGDAMYQMNDLPRAGVLYAQVAAASPDEPRAQLGFARVALRERRLDDAVSRYRALAAAHPGNPVAAEGLGAALDLKGQHTEAQAVYRAALRQHPDAQGLRNNLGLSLILGRQPREGANVLLDVAGLADAPVQARQNLALAYGMLGNDEAARRILKVDLPSASVDDDVRFYERARTALSARPAGDPVPSGAHAGAGGATDISTSVSAGAGAPE